VISVRISGEALEDLNEGFLFYEAQAEGLGDYFTSCLRADIEALKVTAGIHRLVFDDIHRALSRIFPYGVFLHSRQAGGRGLGGSGFAPGPIVDSPASKSGKIKYALS